MIVIFSFLFISAISIMFEIPEWIRSRKLSKLALKYNLTFKRVKNEKRRWLNGWGIFSNDESNFIYGRVKDVFIEFNDCLLVEGTLNDLSVYGTGLHSEPSITEISNMRNLSGSMSGARTQKVSKLNGIYYKRLTLKSIDDLLEKISVGQINSVEDVKNLLGEKDFSNHIMKNRRVASFVFVCLFSVIFYLAILIYNNSDLLNFENSLAWICLFDFLINIPVYIWISNKYGKRFTPDAINKPQRISS